jgi:O-antigen/teichoic acid export membrane protein
MIKEKLLDKRGFTRNFLALSSSSFLLHLVNMFTNMYLARTLEPEGFGFYGVIITWSSILQAVAALGIDQVTTRSVAKNQDNSILYFRLSVIVRLIGLIITSILFTIYCLVTNEINIIFIILIILNTFAATIWNTIQCVAFGMRRMESTGYINVIGSTCLLIIYLLLPSQLVNVAIIYLLFMIVQVIKDYYYYMHSVKEGLFTLKEKPFIGKKDIFAAIRESSPFYILVLFSLVTSQLPVLFLSENAGNVEVAYFNTANKLLIPLSVILTTMFQALFPILVEEKDKQPEKLRLNVKRAIFMIVSFGIICCISISLLRNEIVYLIYGKEYSNTGMVMLTQCWYVVYFALLTLYGTLYVVLGKDKLLATLSIINGLVWAPFLWVTSYNGATSISYGFVIGAAINLMTNSIAIHYADNMLISSKILLYVNFIMALGFILTIIIPINISLVYRIIITMLLILSIIPLYRKFLNLSKKRVNSI